MANYIQLIDKTTNEPESFAVIDEKLCEALGVTPHEKWFYCMWYDVIGYSGAPTIQDVISRVQDQSPEDKELLAALQWLNENYTLNAWYSR